MYPPHSPPLRRRIATLVVVSASLALGACRDVEVLAGPEDLANRCTTSDCAAFRGISQSAALGLVRASDQVASSLRNTNDARDLRARLGRLQSAISANQLPQTRLALVGVLAYIDGAMGPRLTRADLADLSAVRLNMEPLIHTYGLR